MKLIPPRTILFSLLEQVLTFHFLFNGAADVHRPKITFTFISSLRLS